MRSRFSGVLGCVALLALGGLTGAGGCASKLETGYEPRKLGSSTEVRRGYYAQPFTPEAKAAKDYEQDFGAAGATGAGSARPRPGY
jgi:hypothetical protein